MKILKRLEGKTLEFKRDLSTLAGVFKTTVAFANTAGGTLLLGVEDKSRQVLGVRAPLDLEERLANATRAGSSIAPRSTRFRPALLTRRSRSYTSTACTAPRSALCVARSAGACLQ